jgi:uncharacterized protein YdcH (DUF465 family)
MPHTVTQIKQIITKEGYLYYCLQNAAAESIIPWNFSKAKDGEHLKKIATLLGAGSSMPDGLYYVIASHSKNPQGVKTKFEVQKGKISFIENTNSEVQTLVGRTTALPQSTLPAGYSFAELLKLERELGELRAAKADAETRYGDLLKDYEELEDELAEAQAAKENSGMADGISQMAQQAVMLKQVLFPDAAAALSDPPPKKISISLQMIFEILKSRPQEAEKLFNQLSAYYEQSQPQSETTAGEDPATTD